LCIFIQKHNFIRGPHLWSAIAPPSCGGAARRRSRAGSIVRASLALAIVLSSEHSRRANAHSPAPKPGVVASSLPSHLPACVRPLPVSAPHRRGTRAAEPPPRPRCPHSPSPRHSRRRARARACAAPPPLLRSSAPPPSVYEPRRSSALAFRSAPAHEDALTRTRQLTRTSRRPPRPPAPRRRRPRTSRRAWAP